MREGGREIIGDKLGVMQQQSADWASQTSCTEVAGGKKLREVIATSAGREVDRE